MSEQMFDGAPVDDSQMTDDQFGADQHDAPSQPPAGDGIEPGRPADVGDVLHIFGGERPADEGDVLHVLGATPATDADREDEYLGARYPTESAQGPSRATAQQQPSPAVSSMEILNNLCV